MERNEEKIAGIEVTLPINGAVLPGILSIPLDSVGLVIFAHGSGSGRKSPRNTAVADILNASRIATLLFDLLTSEEDTARSNRFNIPLLAHRLQIAVDWAESYPLTQGLPIALFGASTGAAAALAVATQRMHAVTSVVSRGGRPDLAMESLPLVRAPSLFIVGGRDPEVEHLNRIAMGKMRCRNELSLIPGASHLFEEGRSLDVVAGLAAGWFLQHFQEYRDRQQRTVRGAQYNAGGGPPTANP